MRLFLSSSAIATSEASDQLDDVLEANGGLEPRPSSDLAVLVDDRDGQEELVDDRRLVRATI